MKNAFIFVSGMATGAAGLAVVTVVAIGVGMVALAIESGIDRQSREENPFVNLVNEEAGE